MPALIAGGPGFYLGQRASRNAILAIKVWKHREINEPQRFVAAGERFTLIVGGSSEVGSRHHCSAARADIDRLGPQRRQEVGQAGLPHPVAQVQGTATPNQQGVSWTAGIQSSQQHIYAFFGENTNPAVAPWYFYGFHTVSDRIFPWSSGEELPALAEYFEDAADLIYDRRLDLQLDYEHILEDHLDDRFPEPLRGNPSLARNALIGTEAQIRDRVYRNYKTAVPQYWRGRVQLLLPLCLLQDGKADLALVVEKERDGRSYRGNTALTLDMAYSNARLLARPDPDWLSQEETGERRGPAPAAATD